MYAGMLSEQSSVFAALLQDVPHPAPQATHEGCPLVWIEDSAKDVRWFLGAMLDTRCVFRSEDVR